MTRGQSKEGVEAVERTFDLFDMRRSHWRILSKRLASSISILHLKRIGLAALCLCAMVGSLGIESIP